MRVAFGPPFTLAFRPTVSGSEYLPRSGAAILAANHASFLDPILIGMRARRPVRFVVSQEFYNDPRLNARAGKFLTMQLGSMVVAAGGVFRKVRSGNFGEVPAIVERAGADAVPIILLLNFLLGFVMGFQAARQLGEGAGVQPETGLRGGRAHARDDGAVHRLGVRPRRRARYAER